MDSTTRFDFRPPQFSEDFIWLPDWLEQRHSQPLGDGNECERPPERIVDGGNLEGPQRNDDARCEDFQLFLSGEDSSQIKFSPCPAKENHFYLRLSFTGSSQRSESQATDEVDKLIRSSKDFPVEKYRSTSQPSAKTSAKSNSCRKPRSHVKDDDLDASIELSIAASEAVVIHELVESEPAVRPLPMESVMEVVMRVKEARLQEIDDTYDVLMEDACADDSLRDLDDLTMLDAFKDVGFPMVIPDESEIRDADVSQVQETPVAKILNTIDWEKKCLDTRCGDRGGSGLSDSLAAIPFEEQPKENFVLESINCEITSDVCKELPSKGSLLLLNEKGMDAAVREKQNMTICIPKLFVCETSFLSESADVAQDQNSEAHNPGSYIGETSEVHVFLHDPHDVTSNCMAFSQEVVGSSCTSLGDPLCSVVPCSIPNEMNDMLRLPACRGTLENSSDPQALFGSGNLPKTTRERNDIAKDSLEPEDDYHNQTGYRRSFLSLKTFSVVSSSRENRLENVPILPGYSGSTPPTDSYNYNRRLTGKLFGEGTSAGANVDVDDLNNIKHSTGKILRNESISGDCMKDAANLLLYEKQERKLPHITGDRKMHLCPQAFNCLAKVCSQRDEEKLILTPPNSIKICQRKKFLQIKLPHNYLKFRKAPRKRVRFSGVDMEIPVSKHSGEVLSVHNKCMVKRSAKRPNHYDSQADQDMKNLARVISSYATPLLFDGIGFLLTGFSRCREKEIEALIHKHGGVVIFDVPSINMRGKSASNVIFEKCLVVVSPKKLKTTKFLYGCAVGALLLKLSWIMDSIAAGCTLPPEDYRILPDRRDTLIIEAKSFSGCSAGCIFSTVGFVLHGKRGFFMKYSKVIKHGGGEAYGNLHQLIQRLDDGKLSTGIIVTELDKRPSRHLHQCAVEREIVMMVNVHYLFKALIKQHEISLYARLYLLLICLKSFRAAIKLAHRMLVFWRAPFSIQGKLARAILLNLSGGKVIMIVHLPPQFQNFTLSDSSRFVRRSDRGVDLIASLCKIYETSEDEVKKTLEAANNLISVILKKKPSFASGCKPENLQDVDSDGLIYFEDLMGKSSLSSSISALGKDYENAVRKGELDERVFLNEEDSLLGLGTLSGGAINMIGTMRKFDAFSSPSKTITSPLSPFRSPSAIINDTVGGSNSVRLASATPVSTAMTTAKWLRTVVSPLPSEPSTELKKFLASCDKDVTDDVIRRVHVILEAIFPNPVGEQSITGGLPSANLMDNIWAEQRRLEAMKLYYRVLEAMCRAEAQILHSSNLTSLLINDRFHRCILACSAELVLATHKTLTMLFPAVLERTGITAFDLSKVIESFIRHEESLPRELRRHLNTLEEQLLERMVWEKGSLMYNSAQPALQKNEASGQNGDIRSPKRTCADYRSGLVERNSFTSPVKDRLLAFSGMKSKLPPPPLQSVFASPTRPHPGGGETRAETEISILFTKITKLAATSLFFNCHIDRIILCCFYVVAKISQTSLTFKEIINNYRKQPHCNPQVFRNVFVDWSSAPWNGKSEHDHVDIITFYNEMFIPSMKPLLVELGPGRSLRNNGVTEVGSKNDVQRPGSPNMSTFPNLPDMSPKKNSASHNVYMDALISHSSRSYYACVGESTNAYQSPSKDLAAINDRINGNHRRVRGTLNFDADAGLVSDLVVANSLCLQKGSCASPSGSSVAEQPAS
ncbi:hypothetical protein MLD38_024085 [Melastoma candidum]|uniref:Uncharacterized protein n=1 Tax=Melastoma candidum TaxID=119954 RepID=A0ACB9NRL3_9MYRT|nr:hypothetical protein MLD38_024085 [Melastoma candidum]